MPTKYFEVFVVVVVLIPKSCNVCDYFQYVWNQHRL